MSRSVLLLVLFHTLAGCDAGTSTGAHDGGAAPDAARAPDAAAADAGTPAPDGGASDAATSDQDADGFDAAVVDAGPVLPSRLRVSGRDVLDPDGHPIVLRGYNWGQFGTALEEDAHANHVQGANSVRIPLRWWGDWRDGVDSRDPDAPGHVSPTQLATLDAMIDWASAEGLWIVLFVDSNYGQGASGTEGDFWSNAPMRQQFWDVWRFLVMRYRDRAYLGAYEILPEPRHDGPNADVRAFYDEGIAVIRALDTTTPIVVGPNDGYNVANIEDAYTTADANLVYTANLFIFDNTLARVPRFATFRDAHTVPMWVNQVGIDDDSAAALASADAILDALDRERLGWAWWTYRSRTTQRAAHGIYYTGPTGEWTVKPEWLALLGRWLAR